MGSRAELLGAVIDVLRARRPVAVLGEAGAGTTTFLREVSASWTGPVVTSGGLRSLRATPYLVLSRAFGVDAARRPEELDALLREQLEPGGLLVLDDVHWADAATLEAVGRIADRVAVLVGIRRGEDGESGARRVVASADGVAVSLPPLSDEECAEIIRSERPGLAPDQLATLLAGASGNPGVLAQLLDTGQITDSLSAALAACTRDCSEAELAALALLGEHDTEGLTATQLEVATDRLLEAQLINRVGDRYLLRHQVTAVAALDALSDDATADVHRRLAALSNDPVQIAEHLIAAGDPAAALPLVLSAVESADRERRPVLLALAASCCDADQQAPLLRAASEAALAAGDRATARRHADAALDLADPSTAAATAALAAECRARDGDASGALDAARRAQSAPDAQDRARASAARALVLAWPLWQPDEAELAAAAARALDPAAQMVSHATAVSRLVRGATDWNRDDAVPGADACCWGHLLDGSAELALEAVASTGPDASELLGLVVELHLGGDVDRLAPRLRALLDHTERPIDREVLTAHLALALADSGRTSAAAALASDALATGPTPAGRALLGWALVEAELAGARLTRARSACEGIDATPSSPASILAALASSWADALAPSRQERAGAAAGATEQPGRTAVPWPGVAAADLERDALAARCAALPPDQVDAAFLAAADRWSGWHRRGALRCRWAAADAALGGSDKDAAIDRLRSVEDEAAALGQRPLVARIRVSLRSAGVRRRPHRGAGRGPLSAREVEVLELVRLGFTSGEAAQSLGVAPSTIDTQVESAMRKLGARTRLQAAAMSGQLPT